MAKQNKYFLACAVLLSLSLYYLSDKGTFEQSSSLSSSTSPLVPFLITAAGPSLIGTSLSSLPLSAERRHLPPPPLVSKPLPLVPAPRTAAEALSRFNAHLLDEARHARHPTFPCSTAPFEENIVNQNCDDICVRDWETGYRLNYKVSTLVDTRTPLGLSRELGSPTSAVPLVPPLISSSFLGAGEEGMAALGALRSLGALKESKAVFLVGPSFAPPASSNSLLKLDKIDALSPTLLYALIAAGVVIQDSGTSKVLEGGPFLSAVLGSPLAVLVSVLSSANPGSPVVLEPASAFPLGNSTTGTDISLSNLREIVCYLAPEWSVDLWRGGVHVYPPLRAYVIPPQRIPPALWDEYTMQGKISVGYEYYNEAVLPGGEPKHVTYTNDKISAWTGKAERREVNYYGTLDQCIYEVLDKHRDVIKGKRVVIMGSLEPWYEVVALNYGAASVFTVEYGPRSSEDPRLQFITPSQMMEAVAAGKWEPFDAAFSISSFEHDGLGRYGDPLQGEGDLRAMKEVLTHVVKPGGYLVFSVPVGGDCVQFNAHRVYGKTRLPRILEGWARVDTTCFNEEHAFAQWPCASWSQPAFLLQRPL